MNQRDTFSNELLSAYLDGELSSEERQEVERLLAESAEHRRLLDDLRSLDEYLRMLPEYRLAEEAARRIDEQIAGLGRSPRGDQRELEDIGELLSAYLDDELTERERRHVGERVHGDHRYQQLLGELRALHDGLKSLPTYQLDDGFADRVVRQAERQTLLGATSAEQPADHVAPATREASASDRSSWGKLVWAAVAVAASVLLMLGIHAGINRNQPNTDTAQSPRNPAPPRAPVEPREQTPLREPQGDGGWQFVQLVQGSSRQKLLLVYELSVTAQGVERAAFANLLRRHGIRFHQTFAVGPKQQQLLLKHRFLRGVQAGGSERSDMDEVQLFLVSCSGRDADAMYHDLVNRPAGFASFYVNLTTKAAEDRVLDRLCEASGVSDERGRAVELLANFAILSRTARNLGTFGSIGWIEPSLLEPAPASPSEEAEPAASSGADQRAAAQTASDDDFPCELLFVVRNLKPLDAASGD